MIEIDQARAEDWPAIARFVARCHGAEAPFKGEARWRWQLEEAPGAIADAARPPSWIARAGDGEVVGQISLQPGRVWLDGEPVEIGWIVDVMVDPLHRGNGLGHRLYRAILDAGHITVTLTMAPATRRIAQRAGCVELPPVAQLLRVQRLSGTTLRRWARHSAAQGGRGRWIAPPLIAPVAALAAGAATLAARVVQGNSPDCTEAREVREIERADPEDVERLGRRLQHAGLAHGERSAKFWRWRFEQAPDLAYCVARYPSDGAARALIAWRKPLPEELPVGTIAAVLADPADGDAQRIVLAHALAAMERLEAVVAGAAPGAQFDNYRAAGFLPVKWHRPTVSAHDVRLLARFARAREWHLDKADHDWDQVHPR
ncbi:GNAT family N-acetyltransferase [Altererythrobacter sp. BO-6]|uniref:GNAT family N-acetyltransferase n=1 Tax=Altererythrobacter sp. BO-6 TaxID=2604537 RepID=UPI0013E184B5|nr:GNAT family N-acetyltransferase [Altererythrobacter sp. BO-6]QIG54012.1 GNAT family N-acetyltransferase [Altererythrobacter sp. BO-6]